MSMCKGAQDSFANFTIHMWMNAQRRTPHTAQLLGLIDHIFTPPLASYNSSAG